MKISELIAELTKIQSENGDLWVETYIPNCCYGDYQEDPDPRLNPSGNTLYL